MIGFSFIKKIIEKLKTLRVKEACEVCRSNTKEDERECMDCVINRINL